MDTDQLKIHLKKSPEIITGCVALLVRFWYFFAHVLGTPHFPKYQTLALDFIEEGWGKGAVFFSSPGYTFIMAAFTNVFGTAALPVRIIQMGVGAVNCVLIAHLSTRIFGRRTGLISGLIAALFGAFLLYESDLLTAVWVVFIQLSVVYFLLNYLERGKGAASLISAGFFTGVSAIIRPNALLLLPLFAAVLFAVSPAVFKRLKTTMLFLIAAVIPIIPVTLHNYGVCGEFIPITASSGSIFYSSNNYRATGLGYSAPPQLSVTEAELSRKYGDERPLEHHIFRMLASRAAYKQLTPGETSDFWQEEGMKFIRNDFSGWLKLELKKAYYFFNDYESADVASTIIRQPNVTSLPFITFGLVYPSALVGFCFGIRKFPRAWFLVFIFAVHFITALMFYITGRLRMPAAAFCIPFSAWGVVTVIESIEKTNIRRFAVSLAIFSVAFVFCNTTDRVIKNDMTVDKPSFLHRMKGIAFLTEGELKKAEKEFLKAVKIAPDGAQEAYEALAYIYETRGLKTRAEEMRRAAARTDPGSSTDRMRFFNRIQENPDDWEAWNRLGIIHYKAGDLENALKYFNQATKLCGTNPLILFSRGIALMKKEPPSYERAEKALRKSVYFGAAYSILGGRAEYELSRALYLQGKDSSALEHARKALYIQPTYAPARKILKVILSSANEKYSPSNPDG